ncbi:MAG: twin-arginine translocation signal domain-containing protein [Planctomycetales bacterium]|nr:twin-arginine translocation signal domain-containing protein [Planctomycetales bacterium]
MSPLPHKFTVRTDRRTSSSRRTFLKAVGAGAIAVAATKGPTIVNAADKAGTKNAIVGDGDFKYECHHGWGEVPSHIKWGETHGVAVDEAGLIYIKHRSHAPEPMDSIAVFDPAGKFVRSFGDCFHGGGHGIDIRKEGNEEFLYLCDVKHGIVAKMTLKGELLWAKGRPMETGKYDDPKARYSPTNICFAPDGGFYIADGYGSHFIHQYDKDGKWVRSWGGAGKEPGQMSTPHGIWLDNRSGRDVSLVVADRANARLQYFTLDGKHIGFVTDVSFPAHFDIRGDVLLVPDLHARVTLLGKDNKVIAHLGYDPDWTKQVLGDGKFPVRGNPSLWQNGRFVHPHDACYDKDGNIFVVEWVPTGRVTKLRKVS